MSTPAGEAHWHVRLDKDAHGKIWRLVDERGQVVEEVERFLQVVQRRGLAPRTRRTYAYDLLSAYCWMSECGLEVDELQADALLEFIDYQQRPPSAAPSTINRRVRLLQRFIAFLTGITPIIPAWQHHTHALSFHTRSRRGSLRIK